MGWLIAREYRGFLQEDLLLSGFDVAVPELLCIRREREATTAEFVFRH